MMRTGDKLICTGGNVCYIQGETYTVGKLVNEKYFELMTGSTDEHWYVTKDDEGIYVRFSSMKDEYSDAWFIQVGSRSYCA
ncbi:hypothetical protein [Psychrobacter sp. LV10R520-6]|uniref:hypothetical protein n=1 Tax=Psychrobacter sp. LV10R520-6 TaxID=1415574 RepID=UPI0024CD596D|nr:hypothetical protein [Psychrobacter sp. LV10R520-6]SNT70938.1 hypothetical protein SAMN04488491_2134 [Psychrobacter sp. LV10R520-6]